MRKFVVTLWLFAVSAAVGNWIPQSSGSSAEFRGVSTVSASVAWISGTNGTFARTIDGGLHWKAGTVADAEKLDFRDVYAVSADTAYLLSAGSGTDSRIYKTIDGGVHWTLQFKNTNPAAFFDGFAFWDASRGITFSDPVNGHFIVLRTTDGGAHWQPVSPARIPIAVPGEAAFAASGTAIAVQGIHDVWFGTGGSAARIFRSVDGGANWRVYPTPIVSGGSTAGIFSIVFRDAVHGIITGGDYRKEKSSSNNFATTADGGQTWKLGARLPGYRSAITYVAEGSRFDLLACGPSGADYSTDGGDTWIPIESTGYNAVSFLRKLSVGFAAGSSGRVAKWQAAIR
jgi:photosystem II stability/assembly factor-like uncharacterized protein